MCGRYAIYAKPKEISDLFATGLIDYPISYNVAPTENVPVIYLLPNDNKRLITMRWGLIPSWQKDLKARAPLINARIETVLDKPSFRKPANSQRCLIMANGYFEWEKKNNQKYPYYIYPTTHKPFAIAGVWDTWQSANQTILSCCIITKESKEDLKFLHDRMPLILDERVYEQWLDPNKRWNDLAHHIASEQVENQLTYHPVTPKMNKATYKEQDCIDRIR